MYKIGLIGYGYWGKILLPYLEQFFDVKIIFGRSIEKKGRFTNDLDSTLSSDIDAVVIATPIGTHYRIVWDALEYNKHVFCEKPLAIEPSMIRELDFIATQKGLHLITDYTYTFSERLRDARKKIERLQTMKLKLCRKIKENEFGVYWILGSHLLAILDMFADIGDLEFEKTDLIPQEEGIISFTGDINGHILVDLNSPNKETEIGFSSGNGFMMYSNLHLDDNLLYAIEYFNDVLNGSIDNKANIARSIAVTDTLWRLE
jgi:hypothetical protein